MTPYQLAMRFANIHEVRDGDNPAIQWFLTLCGFPTEVKDETPWCSAFVNAVAWILGLNRSRSAAARSWLGVGVPVPLSQAQVGFDVVVLARGDGEQPGPEVVNAQGHVGFFAGFEGTDVLVLGGNQGDAVSIRRFRADRVLGVRRLS